jgi:RNA polymerase sigma-70 factor (ECF subfamily)
LADHVIAGQADGINHLVVRAQQGEPAAFDALLELFGERLFRFVRSRLPASEAEDVTQRVLVQMIEGLPRYEDRGLPFASWLFRIARNCVIDARRAERDELPLQAATAAPSDSPGPEDLVEAAAGRTMLARAMMSLPEDQRDVIAYRFFADLTTREIAALLGKHEGTVRVLQFRALRSLRRRLAPTFGPRMDRFGFEEADS